MLRPKWRAPRVAASETSTRWLWRWLATSLTGQTERDEEQREMSEYLSVTGSSPSAAFFDLDRTLISGSSAFTLAIQARKVGLVPNSEFVRDAAGAVSFKLF